MKRCEDYRFLNTIGFDMLAEYDGRTQILSLMYRVLGLNPQNMH